MTRSHCESRINKLPSLRVLRGLDLIGNLSNVVQPIGHSSSSSPPPAQESRKRLIIEVWRHFRERPQRSKVAIRRWCAAGLRGRSDPSDADDAKDRLYECVSLQRYPLGLQWLSFEEVPARVIWTSSTDCTSMYPLSHLDQTSQGGDRLAAKQARQLDRTGEDSRQPR